MRALTAASTVSETEETYFLMLAFYSGSILEKRPMISFIPVVCSDGSLDVLVEHWITLVPDLSTTVGVSVSAQSLQVLGTDVVESTTSRT